MQTFLPYASFADSAGSLDYRRLGKQRVECKQILLAMGRDTGGWRNHPCTVMWRGYQPALCKYAIVICEEWIKRGYKDTLLPFFIGMLDTYEEDGYPVNDIPPWLGYEPFHASHRGNLIRKDHNHYRTLGWTDSADLPYLWYCPNTGWYSLNTQSGERDHHEPAQIFSPSEAHYSTVGWV